MSILLQNQIIDTHCHLQKLSQTGLNNFIKFCQENRVKLLLSAAIKPGDWTPLLNISQQFEEIKIALGIHPWYISNNSHNHLKKMDKPKFNNMIVVGEIGLDKINTKTPLDLQLKIFEQQLVISRHLDLPPVIHCCKAYNELIGCVKKTGLPSCGGIIHAYNGSPELTDELLDLGFSFSLGNIFQYELNEKKRSMLKKIYPDHFLLESDFFPENFDAGNDSNNYKIFDYLQTAALVLNEDKIKIAENSMQVAKRIFKFIK